MKMMTGCSDMRRWILVSVDSSSSMDSEDELLIVGLSSTSFELTNPAPIPCICEIFCSTTGEDKRQCFCCNISVRNSIHNKEKRRQLEPSLRLFLFYKNHTPQIVLPYITNYCFLIFYNRSNPLLYSTRPLLFFL